MTVNWMLFSFLARMDFPDGTVFFTMYNVTNWVVNNNPKYAQIID